MDKEVILLFVVAMVGGAVYLWKKIPYHPFRRVLSDAEAAQRRQAAKRAIERRNQRAHVGYLARKLQISLVQLKAAPDFRRAASWAVHTKGVPVAFRQRQFRRFRDQLVEHAAARLAAGENRKRLQESLMQLVRGLGVKPFEAEYILREAVKLVPRPAPPAPFNFQQHAQQLQREHDQRLTSIGNLENINDEIREQMEEAEEQRFADAMLELNDPVQRQGS